MQEQGAKGCLPRQDSQDICSLQLGAHAFAEHADCWVLWRLLLWIWHILFLGTAHPECTSI